MGGVCDWGAFIGFSDVGALFICLWVWVVYTETMFTVSLCGWGPLEWGRHARPWTWPTDILRLFHTCFSLYHGGDMHTVVVPPFVGKLLLLLLLLLLLPSGGPEKHR